VGGAEGKCGETTKINSYGHRFSRKRKDKTKKCKLSKGEAHFSPSGQERRLPQRKKNESKGKPKKLEKITKRNAREARQNDRTNLTALDKEKKKTKKKTRKDHYACLRRRYPIQRESPLLRGKCFMTKRGGKRTVQSRIHYRGERIHGCPQEYRGDECAGAWLRGERRSPQPTDKESRRRPTRGRLE